MLGCLLLSTRENSSPTSLMNDGRMTMTSKEEETAGSTFQMIAGLAGARCTLLSMAVAGKPKVWQTRATMPLVPRTTS